MRPNNLVHIVACT
ncbi:hypothetical protein F383_38692 [Gossypium arboreum]|uniref:Uncharacterized protein n=2 Tax=Gossypium arboreum TaxID=29729 RepID=A0A0B0MKH9_GOSAR|nr:hypothetical protein F383_38692 [Gossypium arboreum]